MHVVIESAEKATLEAKSHQAGMVLWTDGSKLNSGKSGAAVVWRNRHNWHKRKRYLGKKKQPFDTELWAIFDALEAAIKETRNATSMPITIFTDSRAALTKIQKKTSEPEGLEVRDLVYQRAEELITNGHSVTLRWVLGHSEVEGNNALPQRSTC